MDLIKIIHDLRQERDKLDAIINSLEELQGSGSARSPIPVNRRGRRSMDAAGRLEVSRRMKKYWEERKKQDDLAPSGGGGHPSISLISA